MKNLWARLRDLVIRELKRGVSPHHLALTAAIGLGIGVFPVLGSTTLLCSVIALALGLNQPLIQLVNYLAYPLQLALIVPFVRVGEWVVGAEKLPFSPVEALHRFAESPGVFFKEFGMAGVHGVIGWGMIVPAVGLVSYLVFRRIFSWLATFGPKPSSD